MRRHGWSLLLGLSLGALTVWSLLDTGLSLPALLGAEGRRQMALFVQRLFPPDLSPALLRQVGQRALETLAVSFLGTLLAVGLAAGLLGGATRTLVQGAAFAEAVPRGKLRRLGQALAYGSARALLTLFRAVPELIWALLFILVVGLGPFAGVLALGVHTAGVLGRLFAEVLENVDRRPCEALQALGASRLQVFLYGMLPQALPELLSFALYRWEVNIRAAAILGFVGAGGLGQQLFVALNLFLHQQLLTLIAATLGLVILVDACSALLRRLLV
ncbi:MAG: ABC transporter permease [Candidatus Tectimicrobiota bacterium]|nr:MAG: ABC transporter permease [Candidatus Tectomicrobia bacterium]